MCKRNKHRQNRWRRICNQGLSILEILISIGIFMIVCIPIIQLLYSIQYQEIVSIREILRTGIYGDGKINVEYRKGGLWNTRTASHDIFTTRTCTDLNESSETPLEASPSIFSYSRRELGLSTTTVLTGISMLGNTIYIGANSSSTTEPDLFAYTIESNLQNTKPILENIYFQDTGPGISKLYGKGQYMILANTGVKSQVDVVRVLGQLGQSEQSGQSGFSISSYVIPGSNSSTSPLTKAVLYADDLLIVGTEKSVLPEIAIFNIHTRQMIGSIEIGYGVNDMMLVGDVLFVAGPRDPEIEIFDISSVSKIGQYDLPGGSGNAKTLHLFGNDLLVGRTKGGNEFVVLEIQNESQGESLGEYQENLSSTSTINLKELLSRKIQWSVDSVLHFEPFTIIFSADEYGEIKIFKWERQREDISLVSTIDIPNRIQDALCSKQSILMTLRPTEWSSAEQYAEQVLDEPVLILLTFN